MTGCGRRLPLTDGATTRGIDESSHEKTSLSEGRSHLVSGRLDRTRRPGHGPHAA